MSNSPQQAPGLQSEKDSWFGLKALGALAIVIIVVFTIINLIGGFPSWKKSSGASGWELAEVISCPMGKESWEKNFGWCKSQSTYEPGTYRIVVREAHWEHALWNQEGTVVIGYMPIPAQGVWLSSWQNTPFEGKFLREAPLGGNQRLGSLIAKIGEGKPFDPLRKSSFEIEEKESLSISVNLPPGKDFFAYNRGKIIIEVEREID